MSKQIYLVRGTPEESYTSFGDRIYKALDELTRKEEITSLSYTITEEHPPAISIIPFKKKKIACISIWTKSANPFGSIVEMNGFEGTYSATEALPVAYDKTWADGEKTPGVCLLTLFRQKKGIAYETFLNRWHNSHTPMSLKYHPLWHYNRNVVDSNLSDQSAVWHGIVEEHMRTRSELLNPFKFFGNPMVIIPRMINVYRDTNSFLEYKTIEPYLVAEYWVKYRK
ncbi:MAG: hypothetical protein P8100_01815 [bacterium]